MKEQDFEKRTCPRCGRTYTERPALSRTDNETLICPDCGTREALESMGISIEEQLDAKGVLVERNDAETSQFALMFEFDGDKNHIRHVLYCCSASRPATEGETTEESKSVKTEKLSLKASALPNGLVKSKTCESTDQTTYDNWYNSVYIPTTAAKTTTTPTKTRS